MNVERLWENSRYVSPISFIIGRNILEVDVTKANISVLREARVIDNDTYAYLLSAPRMERLVYVGNMQARDTKVTEILKNRLKEVRETIFKVFAINEMNVLSIRNDAIIFVDNGNRQIPDFVHEETVRAINQNPLMIQNVEDYYMSPWVHFRVKNNYTSYYKIGNKEILYFSNPITNEEKIDVAGIGDESLELHKGQFLDLLCCLFNSAEHQPIEETLTLLHQIYDGYIHKNLDVEVYRRFDAESRYDIDKSISELYNFQMDNVTEEQKSVLDISYNEKILRELQKMYASMYFMQKK